MQPQRRGGTLAVLLHVHTDTLTHTHTTTMMPDKPLLRTSEHDGGCFRASDVCGDLAEGAKARQHVAIKGAATRWMAVCKAHNDTQSAPPERHKGPHAEQRCLPHQVPGNTSRIVEPLRYTSYDSSTSSDSKGILVDEKRLCWASIVARLKLRLWSLR